MNDLLFVALKDISNSRDDFYYIALVRKPGGHSTLVKRYGRNGSTGVFKVEHGPSNTLRQEFEKMYIAKMRKGSYQHVNEIDITDASIEDIEHGLAKWGMAGRIFDVEDEDFTVEVAVDNAPAVPSPTASRRDDWGTW